ncbi:MAG: hypothetical protein IMZ53_00380 [Thermoplasmata archaeon]|nr:hypothetical protein [Thermoplasmata archaeon]
MNEQDRDSEEVLRKLSELGGCDSDAGCNCTLHALLLRILTGYDRAREEDERRESERQFNIEEQKLASGAD